MTESKFKRIVVAATVGAVILLTVLLTVMVYQLISISVNKSRMNNLDAQIAEYNRLIAESEDTIAIHSDRLWIELEARRLGLVKAGEIGINS